MWTWVALLLGAAAGGRDRGVALAAFFAIGAGFIGCYWAGRVSDAPFGVVTARVFSDGQREQILPGASLSAVDPQFAGQMAAHRIARRARVTIWAMGISGVCCLLVPAMFNTYWLLVVVCLVWGASVVADSAQFSTIVSEVSDKRYIGTALTMQTALGFLLTVVSIRVTGAIATAYGWRVAAATMAIGPALGIIAMWRLMREPREKSVMSDEGFSIVDC